MKKYNLHAKKQKETRNYISRPAIMFGLGPIHKCHQSRNDVLAHKLQRRLRSSLPLQFLENTQSPPTQTAHKFMVSFLLLVFLQLLLLRRFSFAYLFLF